MPGAASRVVLVVVDGLPWRHVGADVTPQLHRMRDEWGGAAGRGVLVAATYPNHATFVTGTQPAAHGVLANHVLRDGSVVAASSVGPATPTLFDALRAAGRHSAAVYGDQELVGVTGARAAAEHWPPDGARTELTRVDPFGYAADDLVAEHACAAWDRGAELLVVQLNASDSAGHLHGPDSPLAHEVYRAADVALAVIADHIAGSGMLIAVSDHDQVQVTPQQPIAFPDRPGVTVIDEGTAALVLGDVGAGDWLDDVDGVAGRVPVDGGFLVWSNGRGFDDVAPYFHGAHGAPDTLTQVAVVAGHDALAAAVRAGEPQGADWAPTIADLLGVDLPSATGRSLLR